jgi:tetratricopeptide (TPR) repeat protein
MAAEMDQRDVDAAIDVVHQAALAGVDQDEDDWRDHPMFRTDLPADVEHHRHFSMFQHVLYDGQTHDSLALQFKEIANEIYLSGRQHWPVAVYWWTRAIDEQPTDRKLRSILHCNRATVSLAQQQYQKAALDADWAIRYDPSNVKAFVRAAHAYQGMARWDRALGAARAGLEVIPDGDPLRAQLLKVIETVTQEVSSIDVRVRTYLDALAACDSHFRRIGVAVGGFAHQWMGNWRLALLFDEDAGETIWPVAVTYDEVLQVDFIEGFGQTAPIAQLLSMMLPGAQPDVKPPPWDVDGRYQIRDVVVYVAEAEVKGKWGRKAQDGERENVEVDIECCLVDVFRQKQYVVPGYPVLYVAVRDSKFARRLGIKWKVTRDGRVPVPQKVPRVQEVAPDAK